MSEGGIAEVSYPFLSRASVEKLDKAAEHCKKQREKIAEIVEAVLAERGFDRKLVGIVVVGSVGRDEALPGGGPDVDLIPVLSDQESCERFREGGNGSLDRAIRDRVRDELRVKVSEGDDLTAASALPDLSDVSNIGTKTDSSSLLTRRVLLLTEGQRAGGELEMDVIRERILAGYSSEDRTRGRHVLSFCNDVARYYRTLCVEYKGRVDGEGKAWATRNMKLRHSRKVWYFANMLMMASLSLEAVEDDDVKREFLRRVQLPPVRRLIEALPEQLRPACRELVERFQWFLDFMAEAGNRKNLAEVPHKTRHVMSSNNPFPALKLNSDVLHREMLHIIDSLDPPRRRRVLNWFLFLATTSRLSGGQLWPTADPAVASPPE
jgi:hypothetical protein